MIREMGDTKSLIVFPEGGRSTNGEIGEFKSGLYYLGKKRPDFELVPVHIDNMNRVLPRGEVLPVPLLSCITFGPPIWLEKGEPKHGISETGPRGRAAVEGRVERRICRNRAACHLTVRFIRIRHSDFVILPGLTPNKFGG